MSCIWDVWMYGCAFHVANDGRVCSMERGHGPYLCVLRRAERDCVGGRAYALFCLVSWEYTQHTQTSKRRHIVPFSHFSPFLLIWSAAEGRGKELCFVIQGSGKSDDILNDAFIFVFIWERLCPWRWIQTPVENTINLSGVRRRELQFALRASGKHAAGGFIASSVR